MQVGHFRIGDVDGNHLSVSHLAGPQAEVGGQTDGFGHDIQL